VLGKLHALLEGTWQRIELLKIWKSRYEDVVNKDGKKVITKVAH
jgi:hypothetical protein